MAVNKPPGDSARKGAVRKRSQLKTKIMGEARWTKRSKSSGQFMDQKRKPTAKPFKGVRREKPEQRSAGIAPPTAFTLAHSFDGYATNVPGLG